MKLKKKPKIILGIILVGLVLISTGLLIFHFSGFNRGVRSARVLHEIEGFGYVLRDNKSARYQELFWELVDVLNEDPIDDEEYVRLISKMFVYDFFSLDEKLASTDIGGTDFVYAPILANFLENAQNTIYRHLESNIYGQRTQTGLPTVSSVEIVSIENESFTFGDTTDENAFIVTVRWEYTERNNGYQTSAVLVFIRDDMRLSLVELRNE